MDIRGKLPPWDVLSKMLVLGLVLVLITDFYDFKYGKDVIHDIGLALTTAAILGFTIDRWLKADIVKDVFSASMGYMLPEELRNEIHWISGFKWMSERTICHVKLDYAEGEFKLTSMIERDVKNITTNTEIFTGYVSIDEWGFEGHTSKIAEYEVIHGDKRLALIEPLKKGPAKITGKTEDILISPKGVVTIKSKTIEFKRPNDVLYFSFLAPTKNPIVEVTAPGNIEYVVEFGHRERVESEKYSGRHTLKGTFLPTQHIRVRWWVKPKSEKPDVK